MKTDHEYNFVFKNSIMTKHGSNSNPDDDPTLLPGFFIKQSSSFHLASIGTRMAINQQNYHHPLQVFQFFKSPMSTTTTPSSMGTFFFF